MTSHLFGRVPRVLTAGLATGALVLASAAPSLARPVGHDPNRPCFACSGHIGDNVDIPTSSLAGTTEANLAARANASSRPQVGAPDDGATTLAVVLIGAGALAAGAGAGFAGGRRTTLRVG